MGWRKSAGAAEWEHEEDTWEEGFNFTVRIFGALAGIIADKQLDRSGGGFMEDMTDVFDMYMLTFIDVDQMHEGRILLRRKHFFGTIPYHDCVLLWLGLAYLSMIMRALA